MKTSDFDYDLPQELIAQEPAAVRDACRMLVMDRETGAIEDRIFRDIIDYLEPGDLLVANETRVLPAQTSALPAAISVKPGYMFNSRSSPEALSFISIASVYSNSKIREDCVCMALSTISSATLAQAGRASVSVPGS